MNALDKPPCHEEVYGSKGAAPLPYDRNRKSPRLSEKSIMWARIKAHIIAVH